MTLLLAYASIAFGEKVFLFTVLVFYFIILKLKLEICFQKYFLRCMKANHLKTHIQSSISMLFKKSAVNSAMKQENLSFPSDCSYKLCCFSVSLTFSLSSFLLPSLLMFALY